MTETHAPPLGSDLLRGADEIALFLFGDKGERRKVYHLAETSKIPFFRLGSMLCARRSVLLKWIEAQESKGWQGYGKLNLLTGDPSRKPPGAA